MIIYGIKNCDKVRAALKQAKQKGHDAQLHDFRVDGVNEELVQAMRSDIGMKHLVNLRSATYRQLPESDKNNLEIETLVTHPTLIKRPVVFSNGHYTIGLPE
ncbi:MAG: arsenate reductase [Proteobacteria bacterium]|nr:arsenate reductase [Pseudomonadota bacterium]